VEFAGEDAKKSKGGDKEVKLIYAQFVKSIQVLAVVDKDGLDVFLNTEEGKQPEPAYLYFSVPIEVFELLTKANMLGCEFVPVPRNAGYSENPGETEITNQTLQAMIENQSKTIIPD
ncbi:MAG: hypothetical protein II670_01745, partial [Alphaproteobacteria bacterium]|nr:hypothetical protein [Alphaproteobacteria bacterium]